jgi:hypothetical protein
MSCVILYVLGVDFCHLAQCQIPEELSIKIDGKGAGWEHMDCIYLAEDTG